MRNGFFKGHGLRNDYLALDPNELGFPLTPANVRRLCDRTTGVGADGLAVLAKTRRADFGCRIFNPDGSEAERSGNGLRVPDRNPPPLRLRWPSGWGRGRFVLMFGRQDRGEVPCASGRPLFRAPRPPQPPVPPWPPRVSVPTTRDSSRRPAIGSGGAGAEVTRSRKPFFVKEFRPYPISNAAAWDQASHGAPAPPDPIGSQAGLPAASARA